MPSSDRMNTFRGRVSMGMNSVVMGGDKDEFVPVQL